MYLFNIVYNNATISLYSTYYTEQNFNVHKKFNLHNILIHYILISPVDGIASTLLKNDDTVLLSLY